jgi:hypothetical protein
MSAINSQRKSLRWLPKVCALAAIAAGAVMSPAGATYNSNMTGVPISVMTYEGGLVLFILANQPSSNGSCNASYFEIDPANNSDAVLGRMYARLLVAYTQQSAVNIGYDNTGACGTNGYIHVYRVG